MRNESLYRQWQIVQRINSSGNRGVSKKQLAAEFEVSARTIARDITNLSSCGFPIYDEIKKHEGGQVFYFLLERYRFPEVSFSYTEMLALYMLHSIYAPVNPFLYDSFKGVIGKISSSINPETAKFLKKLQSHFLPDLYPHIKEEDTQKLLMISEAIVTGRMIRFHYSSLAKEKDFDLTPLGIKFYHNNFYIAAWYEKRKTALTFAVNRMSELTVSSLSAEEVDVDINEYFNAGFGFYHGETFQVKLQFQEEIRQLVLERNWHPDQKITENKDGSVILEMPASNLQEMVWFVLNYGCNIKVLEPQELREKVLEELKKTLACYNR